MTDRDIQQVAVAFAETEAILEDNDPDGLGMSAVRICQDRVAVAIGRTRARFSRAHFDMECFPKQHERQKQAILAALGKAS